MQITNEVFIVGSGLNGFGLSSLYDCNVYLIDGGKEKVLIDSGTGLGTGEILDNIRGDGFDISSLRSVLLTHCHADHAGGALNLKRELGLAIYAPEAEASILSSGQYGPTLEALAAGLYPQDFSIEPIEVDALLNDNSFVRCGPIVIRCIHTPGHSPGSTCFLVESPLGITLFSGDTVFIRGYVGLFNDDRCNIRSYRSSIKKLSSLKVDALLPGHGGFSVRFGQFHINKAIEAFGGFSLPPHG